MKHAQRCGMMFALKSGIKPVQRFGMMSARRKSLIKTLVLLNYSRRILKMKRMMILRLKDPSRKLLKSLTSFPKKYTTKRKSLRTRMNGKMKTKLRRNVSRSRETNAKWCQEKSALRLRGMNAKVFQAKSAARLRETNAKWCQEKSALRLRG